MSSKERTYKRTLLKLLDFKFPDRANNDEIPATPVLIELAPDDIVRFFKLKAYGKEEIGEDDLPTCCRSGTLLNFKKHISYFMPRKNVVWDSIRKDGNPTKSIEVNNVISEVKLREVRKQGVPSQARRALEMDELLSILTLARNHPALDDVTKFKLGSVLTNQWAMIGRIDDMMKLLRDNILPNLQYPFTLLEQISWSKNIREERDSPAQLLLGSGDERLCVLLNMAVYLEILGQQHASIHWLYGVSGDSDMQGHRQIRQLLCQVLGGEAFG